MGDANPVAAASDPEAPEARVVPAAADEQAAAGLASALASAPPPEPLRATEPETAPAQALPAPLAFSLAADDGDAALGGIGANRSIPVREARPAAATLAAAMPDRPRRPMMASVEVPRPSGPLPAAANDRADERASDRYTGPSAAPLPPTVNPGTGEPLLREPASVPASGTPSLANALAPRLRTGSILGLSGTVAPVATAASAVPVAQAGAVEVVQDTPEFSYQDELILELQVAGHDATDTIVAYSTPQGIYLPLGTLVRILDLAVRISDQGHYALGWVLAEDRVVRIDLRQGLYEIDGREAPLPGGFAVAFDGEMYLRGEDLARFIPVEIETSLRSQSVLVKTLQPFPFEERLKREADRKRLAQRGEREEKSWPREQTPWLVATVPGADVQLRAVSRSGDGEQLEGDLILAGDLAMLSAQVFLSANSRDGLVSSLVELGRLDPDGQLLGPLRATEFAIGDVASPTMPLGLRSVSGRGFALTNAPLGTVSAFDRIDLRGVLQDGYEVELYRNEILIGSTRERINGRYEFLQVPVDFGLNVFRLVFFGPQGQRYEEVRNISVGDGRLSQGELVYRVGAVQKDQNVLGVRDPDFIRPQDFGDWRAAAELSYGVSSDLTTVMSAAWYQDGGEDRWTATGGIRTGLGRFALKADLAAANGGAYALSAGIGGRLGRSAFTVTHFEYRGEFLDETRIASGEFLRRATEVDFNSSLSLGDSATGLSIPVAARLRRLETRDGRTQTAASLRASTRLSGLFASNTLEYTRNTVPGGGGFTQLLGNFDLATVGRSRTRARASLGYAVLPEPELVSAALEVDHALDERTSLRGAAGYVFASKSTQLSASARRDFDRFSLSLDGNYAFGSKDYAVVMRLGLSFGRDPLTGRFFTSRQSLAGSGSASLMAFHDRDADGVYGAQDAVLPDIDFIAFNATARTDERGVARLTGLGTGRPVSIQIDTTSLPDIDLAPATDGFEIVPRVGRVHGARVPIVSLSEVEGTLVLERDGRQREVSGVRLELRGSDGTPVAFARTEIDGYYFFERVLPGSYTIAIDSGQASRLGICLKGEQSATTGAGGAIVKRDLIVVPCS